MLQFLADKLNAGALLVSQLLLTAVVGTDPYFHEVELELRGDRLHCSARLEESFTPDLDVLLQSGDTVTIHFEVDLVDLETGTPLAIADWEHWFIYSILEDEFSVYKSEIDKTFHSNNFLTARQDWVVILDAPLARLKWMEADHRYQLRMSAYMDEISMPGMTDKLNLMSYWNRIRPVHTSEPFMKRQLVQ